MVRIRLKRMGAKNQPAYRVVVVDGRSPRDGRFIEEVGYYEPLKKGNNAKLKLGPRGLLDQMWSSAYGNRSQHDSQRAFHTGCLRVLYARVS